MPTRLVAPAVASRRARRRRARACGGRSERLLAEGGFTPPDLRQLGETTGLAARALLEVLTVLEREGRVVRIAPDLFYARDPADEALARLDGHLPRARRDHRGRVPRPHRREPEVRHRVPRLDRPDRRHAPDRRRAPAASLSHAAGAPAGSGYSERPMDDESAATARIRSPTRARAAGCAASSAPPTCPRVLATLPRPTHPDRPGRHGDVRRRRRVPSHARSRARPDRRLLLAHRRRPVPVRCRRRRQRDLRRLRHGRRAAHGAQHRVLSRRAGCRWRCWGDPARRHREGRRGRRGRARRTHRRTTRRSSSAWR